MFAQRDRPATPAGPGPNGGEASAVEPVKNELGDTALQSLYERATASGAGPDEASLTATVEVLPDGVSTEVVRAAVASVGGQVKGEVPDELVEAMVPASALAVLARSPGVAFVRTPLLVNAANDESPDKDAPASDPSITNAVIGEETSVMNLDVWHQTGYNGQGVKVGIIDGFSSSAWSSAQSAGEVAAPAGTFCRSSGSSCSIWSWNSVHGVAVAETIHEQAPSAQIYLATADTTSDLLAAVDYFASQGVKIVTRSLTSEYDGPGDGTGPIATVVVHAALQGITWFNSAGNSAGGGGWEGSYWRGSWYDSDGDGYMNFGDGSEYLGIWCTGGAFVNGLRWSDWSLPAAQRTDYDATIVDASDNVVSSSYANQQTGAPPLESGLSVWCSSSKWLYLKIRLYAPGSGTNDTLEFMLNHASLDQWQNSFSASAPVVDSKANNLIAVGAIDPPTGTTIAPYSAQGPTNDYRTKPDISAPSCFNSYTYSSSCFNGTSAATPAAAGAAAVVLGSGVASTGAELVDYVKSHVVDRGSAGFDNTYGRGELVLGPPPAPGNDAWGNAFTWTPAMGNPISGRNISATKQTGEPNHAGKSGGASVWWRYTPTSSGLVTISTQGSTFDTMLGVYTGVGVGALTHVASNDDGPSIGTRSVVSFYATSGVSYSIAVDGWNGSQGFISMTISLSTATTGSTYNPIAPTRILDSRTSTGGWSGKLVAGSPRDLQVTGLGGATNIPTSATAVVMNVTATGGSAGSFVTVYPPSASVPTASNLNFAPNQTVPNLVTVMLASGGKARFANAVGSVHIVADVVGWYGPSGGSRYNAITPVRMLDSRTSTGGWSSKLAAGTPRDLVVRRPNNPFGVPATATAVVANVTVTNASTASFVSVWPSGVAQPNASNLNFGPNQTIANLTTVQIGTNGAIRFANAVGTTDVVVDVVGYYDPTTGDRFHPIAPVRALDDRYSTGVSGPWGQNESRAIPIGGITTAGVPGASSAVVMNVTATGATAGTFITVYPEGVARPSASNLNVGAQQTLPNLVVTKTGVGGMVDFYNAVGAVDLIADVVGYFGPF